MKALIFSASGLPSAPGSRTEIPSSNCCGVRVPNTGAEIRTRARSPDGSLKRIEKPRVTAFVLSEILGLLPPMEKRAVTGTVLANCGAFDRLPASAVGAKLPLTQTPFAPLARTF